MVNSFLSLQYDPHDTYKELLSNEFWWTRQLRQYKHVLSCFSQYRSGFLHRCSLVFCKALLLASELLTSYERFFMMSLKSLSSSSMKKIQRNFLASSSFGFSIAHFCFAFRFTASDICFHISCHALSGLDVVCFLVSLTSRPCISVRWPFKKISLVKPVHASDSSSNVQYVFPTIHPVTHVLFW